MLIVAGTVSLDPEKRDRALADVIPIIETTRAEDGCIDYVFSADPIDVGLVRVFEMWDTEEALAAHLATPHVAEFGNLAAGWGVTGMSIEKHLVSSSGPVM